MQKSDGGDWIPLTTTLDRTNYHPVWSPDGKKILFGNKTFSLYVLDVESRKLVKVAESRQGKNDEFFWEISDYSWAPDSRWVCYSIVQYNRNSQIFLYSLDQEKNYPVTDDFFDNLNPCFDASGKYLYYLSSRNFDVHMDFYEDNHIIGNPQNVIAVQLAAGDRPPFGESEELSPKAGPALFRIDVAGIQARQYVLPVPAGNYFYLRAGNGKVLWCSVPKFTEAEYEEIFRPKGTTKWDLHIFDMDQKKEAVLAEKIKDYRVSLNGERLVIQRDQDLFTTSVEKAFQLKSPGEKVNLSGMIYEVDPLKEWEQIFNDTWRWYRDFFYDPGMHGRDWKAMGEKYRAYLPALSSREELNWVLQQLVGELSVSHTYISGGDNGPLSPPSSPIYTGLLGADIRPDSKTGYYRLDKIYGPTEYNLNVTAPLCRPDFDIKEGDYLLAINGVSIRPPADYFKMLQVTAGQKVSITVNRKPTPEGGRTYEVTPLRRDGNLRYLRWLTDNIHHVLQATDGKVGYMHINAMGSGGIAEFDKFWRAFRYKDGIIIDVRRNSGGWTEYFLIDKLERKPTSFNVLKERVPFRYPPGAGSGQYVAISNEDNGSDGEAFIEDFKERKLGPVVGVPSWGGLVGILNTQTTIDNGTVEQSNNAFYGPEGKWLVENHGADPDILIDNDPASVVAGKDPQLDKAIEVILKNIREHPFIFPAPPPYPVK
jgi:tricorn protease